MAPKRTGGSEGDIEDDLDVDIEDDDDEEEPEKSLPQTKVNDLLAKERKRAERAATRKVTEALGMSLRDASKLLETVQQQQQADMTDAQRVAAEANTALTQARAIEAEAAQALLEAKIIQALHRPGAEGESPIRPERIDLAAQLAFTQATAADPDDDPDDVIEAAVNALRLASPEWFGASSDGGHRGPTGGTTLPPVRKGRENAGPRKGSTSKAEEMFNRFRVQNVDRRPHPTE